MTPTPELNGHEPHNLVTAEYRRIQRMDEEAERHRLPPVKLEAKQEEPGPPRFIIRTEAELADLPPPSWLLPDELLRGGFHLVYGASGSGKTFYALDRALRAASMGARCLYIATEDLTGLKLRVAAWRHFHPDAAGQLVWLEMPEGLDLGSSAHLGELLATLHGLELDLITVDTLREAHTGDENSSQDMAAVNRAVQRIIRETGAAVDLVHHSGVNEGRERGSTALGANCDLKWKVTAENDRIAISCEKFRHGPVFTPRYYRITPVQGVESGAVLLPAALTTNRGDSPLTAAERKVLELLALSIFEELGAKTSQIAEGAGVSQATLYRVLSTLKRRGYLTQGSKGDPYRITAAGRAQLGPEYAPAPAGTLSEDNASDSATITTLNQLSGTLSDSASSHSSLSLTLTTPRGESERESRERGWGEMRGDPAEYAKREEEAAAIRPAIERWAAEHTLHAWEQLRRACGSLCYPQQALENAGVPLLPDGWQLKRCDTKGRASRYGIKSIAIGPGGEHTEVHERSEWAVCEAWQLVTEAERPAAAD